MQTVRPLADRAELLVNWQLALSGVLFLGAANLAWLAWCWKRDAEEWSKAALEYKEAATKEREAADRFHASALSLYNSCKGAL